MGIDQVLRTTHAEFSEGLVKEACPECGSHQSVNLFCLELFHINKVVYAVAAVYIKIFIVALLNHQILK